MRPCDLRECEAFVILPVNRVCGCMRPWAAKCREEPGQFGMGGHDAAVSLGPVLELSRLALAAIVGPLAARVGRRAANVRLAGDLAAGGQQPGPRLQRCRAPARAAAATRSAPGHSPSQAPAV